MNSQTIKKSMRLFPKLEYYDGKKADCEDKFLSWKSSHMDSAFPEELCQVSCEKGRALTWFHPWNMWLLDGLCRGEGSPSTNVNHTWLSLCSERFFFRHSSFRLSPNWLNICFALLCFAALQLVQHFLLCTRILLIWQIDPGKYGYSSQYLFFTAYSLCSFQTLKDCKTNCLVNLQ